jgi:hypothetical protein
MQSIIIIIRCYKLETEKTEPNRTEPKPNKTGKRTEPNRKKTKPNPSQTEKTKSNRKKYFSISVIDIVIFI